MDERELTEAARTAYQKSIECNGCETCMFEGDGSCEPDGAFEAYFIDGYKHATTALREQVRVLRSVLKECDEKWNHADNGTCSVCRIGHRLYDLKGNVQTCENANCLSNRIRRGLYE